MAPLQEISGNAVVEPRSAGKLREHFATPDSSTCTTATVTDTAPAEVSSATEPAAESATNKYQTPIAIGGRRVLAMVKEIEGIQTSIGSDFFARHDIAWTMKTDGTAPLANSDTRAQFAKVARDVGLAKNIEKFNSQLDELTLTFGITATDIAYGINDLAKLVAHCDGASSALDHSCFSLATIQEPTEFDAFHRRITALIRSDYIDYLASRNGPYWDLLTVSSPFGDEVSDILSCTVAESADANPDEQTLLRSEAFPLIVFLYRQMVRHFQTSWDRPKTRFSVTVIAFTWTHVRVHEACLNVPSDPRQGTSPFITITRHLNLGNSQIRGGGPVVEQRWLDILSYTCLFRDPEKERSSPGLGDTVPSSPTSKAVIGSPSA